MDAVTRSAKIAFVKQQLATYSGPKKELKDSTFVLCPFHGERTPSGRVFHSEASYGNPGRFKCYGCSAVGQWNDVAPKLGLEPFYQGPPKEEYAVNLMSKALAAVAESTITDVDQTYELAEFKFSHIPTGKRWRTIPTDLLIELGGRLCYKWYPEYNKWGTVKMLHFPVTIQGREEGWFRARLKKEDDKPSYLNAGGKWTKTHGLWPFDYAIDLMISLRSRSIVLVEGQRDALRLCMNGIPSMCIFGTQSWSEQKQNLLEIAGVDHIILMMDGDCAGILATKLIHPMVKKMFKIKTIKLWSIKGSPYLKVAHYPQPSKAAKRVGITLWDPGNVPQRIVDNLKHQYFS